MPPAGPLVVVLPVRQLCPPWAAMHITIAALLLARILFHWVQFAVMPLGDLPDLTAAGSVYNLLISARRSTFGSEVTMFSYTPNAHYIAALPLARIYFTSSKVRPAYSYTKYIAKLYKGTHQRASYVTTSAITGVQRW